MENQNKVLCKLYYIGKQTQTYSMALLLDIIEVYIISILGRTQHTDITWEAHIAQISKTINWSIHKQYYFLYIIN